MRTVFPNHEIPHLWAHQTQDSARNSGGSYWFGGPILFSYSTPIAVLATNDRGEQCAVFTTRHYSNTTSGHQSGARSAASHLRSFFVPDLAVVSRTFYPESQRGRIASHLECLATEAATARDRVSRAKRFDAYRSAVESANEFCAFFDLQPFPVPESEDAERILAEIREQQAEKARLVEEKRAREEKKRLREAKGRLKKWLAGESVGYLYGLPTAYMRINPSDPESIETSLGATVPTAHVRRFAPLILRLVRSGEPYVADPDAPVRFGHYRLDLIGSDGTVHVGCHRFDKREIERVAKLIGVVGSDGKPIGKATDKATELQLTS